MQPQRVFRLVVSLTLGIALRLLVHLAQTASRANSPPATLPNPTRLQRRSKPICWGAPYTHFEVRPLLPFNLTTRPLSAESHSTTPISLLRPSSQP
ncbi:hypothetical protein FKP32DRAFT_844174 [Trametes sanguinea]|nr:hypothetical protein FKP32DRAFT_844174 [Trametes sanguinea]